MSGNENRMNKTFKTKMQHQVQDVVAESNVIS
jgi:hypothetical protein